MSQQEARQRRQPREETSTERTNERSGSQQAQEYLHKGEILAKDAYNKMCDTCGQLRGYPRLMTALLLLSAFCLGIGTTAIAGRMGMFVPSTGHFTRDPYSIKAHAALDTLLTHMHGVRKGVNNKVDETSDKLSSARELLIDVMASRAKDWRDSLKDRASELGEKLTDLKDSAADKAAELKDRALHQGEKNYKHAKKEANGWSDDLKDRIRDIPSDINSGLNSARDAANDAYYSVKGKVLGKKEEVKENPIKSTLHKAENHIKDALHAAGQALHMGA